MTRQRDASGKTRFYVPFMLAFLVFSAVLATEFLIIRELLDDAYQEQTAGYHAISSRIIRGHELFPYVTADSLFTEDVLSSWIEGSAGVADWEAHIMRDSLQLQGYTDSILVSASLWQGFDLENRIIETSVAKTTDGEMITIQIISTVDKQIKTFNDMLIALIIILIVMVIFALVPGGLMIESFWRRRKMTGPVRSSRSTLMGESVMEALGDSSEVGIMVVSSSGDIVTMNSLCREILEVHGSGTGSALISITSLPDSVRLPQTQPEERIPPRIIRINSMTGKKREVFLEVYPCNKEIDLKTIVYTFVPIMESRVTSADGGRNLAGMQDSQAVVQSDTRLISSIIHDMRNHLSGIMGTASIQLDQQGETNQSKGYSAILSSTEKLTTLCSDIQNLVAGGDSSELKNPVSEVNMISEVLKRILPSGVKFQVTGSSGKLISVSRELLREFIYNLALNSTETMNGEGRIRIDVSERIPAGASGIGSISPDSMICIRYSDGFIMPVGLRDILSSRKYSPGDVERQFGTTLGTLYRVANEMEGRILFERGTGETVLCLLLQAVDTETSSNTDSAGRSTAPEVKGLSVLVADEVEIVRHSTSEYLEHCGMTTTSVSDGDSAMELLKSELFDVAVLDLNMPGTPTTGIVRYCQTSLPGMAVIITTGYGISSSLRGLMQFPSTDCINKPHRPEVLVETIHSTLKRIHEGEGT